MEVDKSTELHSKVNSSLLVDPNNANKQLDEIDTIELKISEIVNQIDSKKSEVLDNTSTLNSGDVESNLIEVIETHDDEEEDNKARVALQQLEAINSSRRKKKPEIGSVVSTKKLHPATIDNNDLIAILSGTSVETTLDKHQTNGGSTEEVIIEGEGHFEVLEVEENETDKQKSFEETIEKKSDPKVDLVSKLAKDWSDDEENNSNTVQKIINTELKSLESESSDVKTLETEEKTTTASEITPFKRTRVIKRKIIWDPDAPETQFSYASLIQPKTKTSPNQSKRVSSPVRRKVAERKPALGAETVEKRSKIVAGTKKKKLTEIDRLLGDEGAANMLNSLEQQSEQSTVFESKNVSLFEIICNNLRNIKNTFF